MCCAALDLDRPDDDGRPSRLRQKRRSEGTRRASKWSATWLAHCATIVLGAKISTCFRSMPGVVLGIDLPAVEAEVLAQARAAGVRMRELKPVLNRKKLPEVCMKSQKRMTPISLIQ